MISKLIIFLETKRYFHGTCSADGVSVAVVDLITLHLFTIFYGINYNLIYFF